jgi:dipeptidyl aminopeptidase/acylaminoacyl peptidase
MFKIITAVLTVALATTATSLAQSKRPLNVDDLYNLREVRDPQRSPDGKWVAYSVTRAIKDTDKNDTDLWMVSWDGQQQIQLTSGPDGESSPKWSPDNKYLAFVSSRQGAKGGQIWLLNRAGGEAMKLTDIKGGVSDYAWSPDSRRFVLVVQDPDPAEAEADKKETTPKTPKPIVVDRFTFKRDVRGYLDARRSHLYLYDIASKKHEPLTTGTFDETSPAWSPDGSRIAFIRRHGDGDIDKAPNTDVFVIDARTGAQPVRLTATTAHEGGRPAWSPDGRTVAYLLGDETKFSAYDQDRLAVIPASGGQPKTLTDALDRPVRSPIWSTDGGSLVFGVVDDRSELVASVPAAGGAVRKLIDGKRVISSFSMGPDGAFAVLASTATEIPEIHALEKGALRRLSHQNDEWIEKVQLGTTEELTSTSKDGTEVHSLVVKPASYKAGQKYPALLRIHGGPNGQDAHSFNFDRELFAAHGYVVVAVNYRGSNGRGNAYQKAIFADWGNKEVMDLLGAMDQVQKMGLADPERLGIGGWSYGGILTNYTIATDTRFKAAFSGAGSSNQITMYGTDQYITQYEGEIGPPWKAQDLWIKISYPFFHADRIRTPTLFMGGEKDFNVPITGSEQMYQALRSLGVDTQLVIYPNQFHGISIPSYKKDRLERNLAWYAKYLKGGGTTTTAGR